MNIKIRILSIGAAMLLLLAFFPISALEIPLDVNKNSQIDTLESNKMSESAGTVKINVYHIKGDNRYSKTVKELSIEDEKALWNDLKNIKLEDYPSIMEFFEAKIEIVKDYELVSNNFTLEDIMDISEISEKNTSDNSEGFEAAFAPILFAGGGLGFGFGIPFFLTSGVFFVFMFGFGLVYCYDFATEQLFELMTFSFIPILMGYLGGFTGLLLLPVVPGFFYSNFLGIGMSALTIWNEIGAL